VIALVPAGLTAVGAVVLAVASFAGGWIVAVAAGLCVLALAVGWPDLLALPDRSGTSLVVGGLGFTALVAVAFAVSPGGPATRPLAVLVAVLAIAVLASFAHELVRQDGRQDVVESLIGTLTGQVVAVLAVGWVLLARTGPGSSAVVIAAAALIAARAAAVLPTPGPTVLGPTWLGPGAALVAGVAAALLVPDVPVVTAAVVAVAVAGVDLALDRLVGPITSARFDLSLLARAALSLAAAGTTAYAVMRMGIG
jgi:hypothetical protein